MTPEQEALVTEYRGWALAVGRKTARRSATSCWDGDLDSAALEGLMQAARSWDGRSSFAGWATFRVRGAVRDEMRRVLSWGPRQAPGYQPRPVAELPDTEAAERADAYGDTDGARVAEIIDLVEIRGRRAMARRRWIAAEVWGRGRTLAAVAAELGVTESRIAQILKGVRAELAEKLEREMAA